MKPINSPKAPKAVGPYSQAVQAGDFIFLSGQIGLTTTGELVSEKIEDQVHQVMRNLQEVLREAGCDFSNVVKTEIYLTDLNDFKTVNEIYESYLKPPYPARVTAGIVALPLGAEVEVGMIAMK